MEAHGSYKGIAPHSRKRRHQGLSLNFAEASSPQVWHTPHQGATPAALVTPYGSDAVRAARILQVHRPSRSSAPS